MVESVLRSYVLEFLAGGVEERPSGSRQQEPPHFLTMTGSQALIDGAVLAVNGNNTRTCP